MMFSVLVTTILLVNLAVLPYSQGFFFQGTRNRFSRRRSSWRSNSKTCTLETGEDGECKKLFHCPAVLSSIGRIRPVVCKLRKGIPVVCCPKFGQSFSTRENAVTYVRPGQDLVPPSSFTWRCGDSPKYMEKHVTKGHGHHEHLHSRRRRYVVGGQESVIDEFPWMALIGKTEPENKKTKWICDGVLVHPEWIITAAHCLLDLSTYVIRLGEFNITAKEETHHQDFTPKDIVFHPDFKLGVNYHDLALVRLSSPVDITDSLMPICFPWENEPLEGKIAVLAGWGAETFGGSLSNVLRDAEVKVFDPMFCDESYSTLPDSSTLWPSGITGKYLICAGGENGGIDSCQGDSGGPLMLRRGNKLEVIGIISKGFGCGKKEFPGIYVAVRSYLTWICDIILNSTTVIPM